MATIYYAIGIAAAVITITAVVWGLGRHLWTEKPTATPNLPIIRESIARDNSAEDTSKAVVRIQELVGKLMEMRRREPALVGVIDEALEELGNGRTAKAESLLRRKLEQVGSNDPAARKKRAEYHRYLAAAIFVHSQTDALRELRAAVEVDPEDAESWNDLGEVAIAVDNLEEAKRAFREALRLARAQGNIKTQFASLIGLGDVLHREGTTSASEGAYRQASTLAANEVQRDPSNAEWQRSLSISQRTIGDILREKGDGEAALKAYRDTLAIAKKLVERDASNTDWQRDLSVSYENIGDILRDMGEREAALKAYEDGLAIRKKLVQRPTSNTDWQRDLSVSHIKIGDILKDKGEREAALKAYQDSLVIMDKLVELDASNTDWQRDLSVGYNKIGDVLRDKGEREAALKAYEDGLAIRRKLVERDASNTRWQRDLSVSHNKIGDILSDKGEREAAIQAYKISLVIIEKLVERDSSMVEWQLDIVALLSTLANLDVNPRANLVEVVRILEQLERAGALTAEHRRWLSIAKERLATMR
jgi:tetratricopeptide (TPR) repeat protein